MAFRRRRLVKGYVFRMGRKSRTRNSTLSSKRRGTRPSGGVRIGVKVRGGR